MNRVSRVEDQTTFLVIKCLAAVVAFGIAFVVVMGVVLYLLFVLIPKSIYIGVMRKLKDITFPKINFEPFSYRENSDSVMGLKESRLVYVAGKIRFMPAVHGDLLYDVESEAKCGRTCGKTIPNGACLCGFYSSKTKELLLAERRRHLSTGSCMMSVRLYGEMIEGPRGFRSQHQIVERVWLPPECSRYYCYRPATCVAPKVNAANRRLYSVCEKHAERAGYPLLTVQNLRDHLGTEVEWGTTLG